MNRPNKCPRLDEINEGHPELPTRPETPVITHVVKIGSRKSKLALIQAHQVLDLLRQAYGESESNRIRFEFELVTMTTKGDQIIDKPLAQIGSKALFTKELEQALLDQEIDLIVHSCKDLPTTLPPGLRIAAILSRENPNDVFVLKKDGKFKFTNEKEFLKRLEEDQEKNWTIGTSSLRRIAQLKHLAPNVKVSDIRGNIDTRLNKLDDSNSDYAALVLAAAGLKRAGFGDRINVSLRNDWWHAVGQGAIALECRENDEFIHNLLYPLIHFKTTYEIIAERSFMQYLEGGCSVPLGVKCWFGSNDNQITTYSNGAMDKNGSQTSKEDQTSSNGKKYQFHSTVDGDQCPVRKATKRSANVMLETKCLKNKQQDDEKSLDNNGKEEEEKVSNCPAKSKPKICPVLGAKRVLQHLLEKDRLVAQEEYESCDAFDCNEISNLNLSGIVYSPDGQRCVQFNASLAEAVDYFQNNSVEPQPKVNCSHVSLPTRACPKLQQVKIDYENCAKLGIYIGKKMVELGASDILDELKQTRKPMVVEETEEGSN